MKAVIQWFSDNTRSTIVVILFFNFFRSKSLKKNKINVRIFKNIYIFMTFASFISFKMKEN